MSAGGENECHIFHMDMASLQYESEHEHEGEQPVKQCYIYFYNVCVNIYI